MSDFLISMDSPLSREGFDQIELFKSRFKELWSNWESLKELGIDLSGNFSLNDSGSISGASCGVDPHRLKGYYLDFRFFWAEKEPTYYFKIAQLIGKNCSDHRARRCLADNKSSWKEEGVFHEWQGIKTEEIISVLFNGYLFHSAPDKIEKLKNIQKIMAHDVVHFMLTSAIYHRMLVIRNLCWMLSPLSATNQYIRVPEEYA